MKLGSVTIETPIMNAACSVAKTVEDVTALAATKAGVVMVGSITVAARDGNPEPRWYPADGYALNSFGMPNPGADFYRQHLPEMRQIVHNANKKFALSVAGFNTQEYVTLAKVAEASQVDILELNLGCPNISVDGMQKPIASFDTDRIVEIIEAVSEVVTMPITVKLSPYSNPTQLQEVAAVIAATGIIAGVVVSNTFPNALMLQEDGEPIVASGLAGMSGRAMFPVALGQVQQFRKALPESIAVIGVGGIESALDAQLFFKAGADMVQAATLIVRDGHAALDRIV